MELKELMTMIEDEVAKVVNEPVTEPASKSKPRYKPVLQNEDDIDDYLFYAGNTPEEIKNKKQKTKKLLSFGK